MLNSHASEQGFIVHNYGCYYQRVAGANYNLLLNKILSMPVNSGDIVIIHERALSNCDGIPFIDISNLFKRPHNYGEVFCDKSHFTEKGNEVTATELYNFLKSENFLAGNALVQSLNSPKSECKLQLSEENAEKLQQYKDILKDYYMQLFPRPIIGAIVMNCNPFTLGHRYLIEYASKRVDHLMIYLVQEDKSYFSFDDRIALVDAGTFDLKNVTVIPSGEFIISSLTFTEYFNKSELQDRIIDSSVDVTLFGQEIAPCLEISIRFIGEEPFDSVTKQYNETIKSVLPKYGIEVVEIPRLENDGVPISASRVREFLEERRFYEISKLVPQATLTFLKDKFHV